jgi:hypothetical protein
VIARGSGLAPRAQAPHGRARDRDFIAVQPIWLCGRPDAPFAAIANIWPSDVGEGGHSVEHGAVPVLAGRRCGQAAVGAVRVPTVEADA